MQYCQTCGTMIGTKESIEYVANKANIDVPVLCEECKQKTLSSVMAKTFGFD